MTINISLGLYKSKRKESLKYVLYLRKLRIANNKDYIQERDNHLFKYKKSKLETLRLKFKDFSQETLKY